MPTLFEAKDFQSIQPYLPDDAKRILDVELPKIRDAAIEQIDQFAESLVNEMSRKLEELAAQEKAELVASRDKLTKELAAFVATMVPSPALTKAAADLQSAVTEHEKRFSKAGELLRQTVVTALQAQGLPVGNIAAVVNTINSKLKSG